MRAARFRQFGGPEVSSVDTVPTPQPGADEVRMKIAAVGLNRADCAQYRGKLPSLSSLPSPLGCEGAGIVEAVGSNVDEGWLGKRVAALPTEFQSVQGTLAEKIVVPIEALVPCPDGFSDAECSAIWLHYLTAYAGLVETAHVGMGDFVLVNSAATNLGIASIQIAKTERATTIAIVGDGRWKNELHNLGADYVLSTDKDDLEFGVRRITRGLGPQVVFTSAAEPLFSKAIAWLRSGGTLLESEDLNDLSLDSSSIAEVQDCVTVCHYSAAGITKRAEKLARATDYICNGLRFDFLHVQIARKFEFPNVIDAY